jgi:hypothetical protein
MHRRSLAYLVTVCAVLAIAVSAWAAETVYPPGLRIGLAPPGDLKPSTRFPGFEDIDRKVMVTIFDLPGNAYAEIERVAEPNNQTGLSEVKREAFTFHSGAGTLISAHVEQGGAKLRQWILLARANPDQNLAMLIRVDVPDAARAVYSDAAIRQALASVTFRPVPIQEQLGLLPFKFGQLAGFRVSKVLAGGSVILTEGPGDDLGKQAYIVVSIGRGSPEQPADRQRFARDMLLATPLREVAIKSGEAMRIGGRPGFEIRAQAKGRNDEPLMVAQWLRFNGNSFFRIVGVARKDEWDAMFTRFRSVRDGVDLR